MIHYFLEVTIAWTLLFLVYYLFLRKETFFHSNRWYLINTLWIGALFPFVRKLQLHVDTVQPLLADPIQLINYSTLAISDSISMQVQSESFDIQSLIVGIYLMGIIITSSKLLYGLRNIYRLYKIGEKKNHAGTRLIVSDEYHLPFSFLHLVFIHRSFLNKPEFKEIFAHEITHVKHHHTFDVLFIEIFAVLFWWNPIIYLYRRAIKQTHEYVADAYASQHSHTKNYGHILLGHSSSGIELALTNQFFNSHLKKRITMLYTKKSARYKMSKYLLALPFILFLVVLFSTEVIISQNTEVDSPQVTLEEEVPVVQIDSIKEKRTYTYTSEKEGSPITQTKTVITEINENKTSKFRVVTTWDKGQALQVSNGYIFELVNLEGAFKSSPKAIILGDEYAKMELIEQEESSSVDFFLRPIKATKQGEPLQLMFEYEGTVVNKSYDIVDLQKSESKNKPLYVCESAYYPEGSDMKDPLIVINGKVSESKDIHYFTKSTIVNVNVLSSKEAELKYGDKLHDGALEFTTREHPVCKTKTTHDPDVFTVVQEMPRYPGCEQKQLTKKEKSKCGNDLLIKWIYENLKYPEEAKANNVEGMNVIQFIVEKDGSLSNFKLLRNIDPSCGAACTELFKKMQKTNWIPGKEEGKAVRVIFTLPIRFKLKDAALEKTSENSNIKEKEQIENTKSSKPQNTVLSNSGENLDKENAIQLEILGNPIINRELKFKFSSKSNDPIEVIIYNVPGDIIGSYKYSLSAQGELETSISLESPIPGSHYLSASQNDETITKKFIVQ